MSTNPQGSNPYYCLVCDINCRTETRYQKHAAGTAHQLASQQAAQQRQAPKNPAPEDIESYFCEACKIDCKTAQRYEKHLSATAHQMKVLQAEQKETKPAPPVEEHKPLSAPPEKQEEKPAVQDDKDEEEEDEDDDEDEEEQTFCTVCNMDCKTESGYLKHTMGMAHVMRAQNVGNVEKCAANTKKIKDIKQQARTAYRCDPCGFIFSDKEKYDHHIMNNRLHPRKVYIHKMGGGVEAFTDGMSVTELDEEPMCLEKLTSSGKSLIGLEHIVEIRRVNPLNPPYYACLLCKEPIAELLPHISNREHRKNYLKQQMPLQFEKYQTLCPGADHEYYGWFRAIYMKDSSHYEKKPEPGEKRKEAPKKWETDLMNALTDAFFHHDGLMTIQVVQENLGQKPRRWPKGSRGMLLRPTTPPVRDPNDVHAKSVDKWQAKRIYVGNIPDGCVWDDLKDFFNRQMLELQLGTGEGLQHVTVNEDKKFAFLQFLAPEEATACLELNGICYQGNYLNLKRPSQYKDTPEDIKRRKEQEAKRPTPGPGRPDQPGGPPQQGGRGMPRGKRPNDGHLNPNQKWGRYEDYNYMDNYYGYDDYYGGYGADCYTSYGGGQYGAKGAASRPDGYGGGNHGNQNVGWQEENGVKYRTVGNSGDDTRPGRNGARQPGNDTNNPSNYGSQGQYGGAGQQQYPPGQQQSRPAQQQTGAGHGVKNTYGGAQSQQNQGWPEQAASSWQTPSMAPSQPPPPSVPPPEVAAPPPPLVPENLMLESLTKAHSLLQKNSICSDGEHRMATQVLNLLKQKIEKFKVGEVTGTLPKIKMPEKTGVLEWLRFLVKLLAKGFLANEDERKAAESATEVLTLRMSAYQTGTPAVGMQPQQAANAAMQPYGQGYANPSAGGYMGYPGYEAYGTYPAAYGASYPGAAPGYNYPYY